MSTKTLNKESVYVANIIRQQLGARTLFMLGAQHLTALARAAGTLGGKPRGPGLGFGIRGSKKVNAIHITLDPSDTYTVKFSKGAKTVSSFEDVYADNLHHIIEKETGLYTSL